MTQEGFIKLHRKIQENVFYKNSEAVHLWLHLLFKASFENNTFYYKNTKIELKKGQLITGRKKLSQETGINESKIFRLLKLFENEQQIEQQTNRQYSIITILSYDSYNKSEQQSEQRMNNERTTDEQRMNTTKELKELKELKEENNIYTQEEFLKFFLKEYEKVFINIPMVSNEMKDKIREIYSNNPTVTDRLPTLFKEFKETKFDLGKTIFRPDITWLLKDNNFYKLANGGLKLKKKVKEETKSITRSEIEEIMKKVDETYAK